MEFSDLHQVDEEVPILVDFVHDAAFPAADIAIVPAKPNSAAKCKIATSFQHNQTRPVPILQL